MLMAGGKLREIPPFSFFLYFRLEQKTHQEQIRYSLHKMQNFLKNY